MDRATLLENLAKARLIAEQGETRIADQKNVIVRFETSGNDVTEAKRLLSNYQTLQDVRFAEIDQLLNQLDKLDADARNNVC